MKRATILILFLLLLASVSAVLIIHLLTAPKPPDIVSLESNNIPIHPKTESSRLSSNSKLLSRSGKTGEQRDPGLAETQGIEADPVLDLVDALILDLKSERSSARRRALEMLGGIRPTTSKIVEAIASALKDPDAWTQVNACGALRRLGRDAIEAGPALRIALTDNTPTVQFGAARALLAQGCELSDVLPSLIEAIRKEQWTCRGDAIGFLGKQGSAAREAVPALLTLLADDRGGALIKSILEALEKITEDHFLEVLLGADIAPGKARQRVAGTFQRMGGRALPASDLLLRWMEDSDSRTVETSANAWFAINPPSIDLLVWVLSADPKAMKAADLSEPLRKRPHSETTIRILEALAGNSMCAWRKDPKFHAIELLKKRREDARQAVPMLLQMLQKGGDWNQHWEILSALQKIDPEGDKTEPAFLELLRGDNDRLRRSVLDHLSKRKRMPLEVVQTVREALDDPDPVIRRIAAVANARWEPSCTGEMIRIYLDSLAGVNERVIRGFMGGRLPVRFHSSMIPVMCEFLNYREKDPRARVAIRWLAGFEEHALEEVLGVLKFGNNDARANAAKVLCRWGNPSEETAEALRTAMKDDDIRIRLLAAGVLRRSGHSPEACFHAARAGLAADSPETRRYALDLLLCCKGGNHNLVPTLIECLDDIDERVRMTAAYGLLELETAPPEAVSPLIRRMVEQVRKGDSDSPFKEVLTQIGTPAVPALRNLLERQDPLLRLTALRVLSSMGENAREALPEFRRELRSPNGNLRRSAAACLLASGEEGFRFLLEVLGTARPEVREEAARVLSNCEGAFGMQAFVALAESAQKDSVPKVRSRAFESLWDLGVERASRIQILCQCLHDSDREVRLTALSSIYDEDTSIAALVMLARLVDSPDRDERLRSIEVIGFAGPRAKKALPVLLKALRDVDPDIRTQAAETIGRLGTSAREAIPSLRAALLDVSPGVRNAAARALRRAEGTIIVR